MPYSVRRFKDNPPKRRYCLVRKDGSVKSCHRSRRQCHVVEGMIHMKEETPWKVRKWK